MKEPANYRDELAEILRATGKHILNVSDVAIYFGKDRKTVRRLIKFENGYVSANSLARQICEVIG